MWFKRVLLGCCIASLAVIVVTASSSKGMLNMVTHTLSICSGVNVTADATLPHRHRIIELHSFPSLERRQQPIGNQTSLSTVLQSTLGDLTTSSIIASSKTFQSSTIVQTQSDVITPEPTVTPTSVSLSSTQTTESSLNEPSSSNGDAVSSSNVVNTEVTTIPSSVTEPQPSETPTLSISTSMRSDVSESLSTAIETTSVVSSSSEEAQTSSTLDISSSSSGPIAEPTTTLQTISSSEITSSTVTESDTMTTSTIDDTISSSATESTQSSVLVSSTQITTSEMSSAVISSLTTSTDSSVSTTIPTEEQPITISSSPSLPTSTPEPSTTSQDPITSSLVVDSSSLAQEPITISTSEQPPISTLVPAPSSMSSDEATRLSTSELQPTTVVQTSSAEAGSSAEISTASEQLPTSSALSTIESDPTPTQDETSSVIETPIPSSIVDTTTTPFKSSTQLSSSLSTGLSLSSSVAEPAPTISSITSSLDSATSSLQITVSPTSEQLPTSSSTGFVSTANDVPSSTIISEDPTFSVSTTEAEISVSATSTLSGEISTQMDPLPSKDIPPTSSLPDVISTETASSFISSTLPVTLSTTELLPSETTSSLPDAISTETVSSVSSLSTDSPISLSTTELLPSESIPPTSSLPDVISTETFSSISSVLTNPPMSSSTTIASETSTTTSADHIPTDSIATSVLSSASSGSDIISSLAPSETFIASTIVSATTSSETFASVSPGPSTSVLPSTQSDSPSQSSMLTSTLSTLSEINPSETLTTQSTASSRLEPASTSASLSLTLDNISSLSRPTVSEDQTSQSQNPTSVVVPSADATTSGLIPTSESHSSNSTLPTSVSSLILNPTQVETSTFLSSGALVTTGTTTISLPSSVVSNGTFTQSSLPFASGVFTATFSTVYISSARTSPLDLSTAVFSLFSSVTGAAVNHTDIRTSSAASVTGIEVPASESIVSTTKLGLPANSTWSSPMQPSLTATIDSGSLRNTSTVLGITFSPSALPTGASTVTAPRINETQAETLQTSSAHSAVNSTDSVPVTSAKSDSASRTEVSRSTSVSDLDEASTTAGTGIDETETAVAPHDPTSTPSQTATAGSPPPLTTSQTAGVAVGATTGLLIAVVAAVFMARRYHAAKHGKRMSTGSVYPKVAYLYDPKTGGDRGDAEALMPGGTGGIPPGGAASRATHGSPKHMQRHSTGTSPVTRFTSARNPFGESLRDPSNQRRSDYARLDTERALSAAVAGYSAARRHSSSYTKHPSHVTDPFSDHVIPSPTFAPFSPDDIRRPELKSAPSAHDGRGEYSQMPVNSYAYLNTAATLYPPISPYERPSSQEFSPFYGTGKQTRDSDPFADPFEHDVLLQVDERNRTSDSVTIFAPSPNLVSPRTPRTPVGPQLPVRQPNGMTSVRSLLSPVAAQYMQKAQKVKIPRKSIASPVLVQVGRSPVIKPFSPPPAAPEPRGWDEFKRHSEKHFSDEHSVPAPLKFASPVIQRKPVPTSHTRMKPSLTGAGQALLAGNGLPLTVNIPHMYKKSVGLDVPKVHGRPNPEHEDMSNDPVVREKRSRELRFADPALIGKEF
ncbi:hypothetical protein OPT61_g7621 [Boeremia exigua]|uniref:Uncharacterized protein n=1 Tax=Boeremia exigua TaxID=749465 RepID=A0ACC2I381_9PLEO|nr:hypothetical protein OPT61_g7621 [Boeremia exigua]